MTTAAPTPTATAQLIALTDAVIGTVIDLTSAEITIGRADHCTVIVRHPLASRIHARVLLQSGRYVLEDAGSVNGTFLIGMQVR